MCFGSDTTSTSYNQNSTYTPAPYLTQAAQGNLGFAQNLQNQGFQPYTGQMVANFSPQQSASFGQGAGIAGAVTPAMQLAGTGLENYLTQSGTPGAPITPNTISSMMSPYMNQYVNLALQPQLAQAANAYMLQNQALQGQATSAGAYGDPRAGIVQGNLGLNYALENMGLVGNAYNAAFNTAIGAGAQDVSNNLNAQIASRNLQLQQLGTQLAGINTAYGQNVGAAQLQNQFGGQQTAQQQAQLNALYNQYLMGLQYPFQTTGLVNQTIGAAVPASPSSGTTSGTSTTTAPSNLLSGILGSSIGALGSYAGSSAGSAAITSGLSSMAAMFGEGGEPPVGKPAIVGDKGPEVFVPKEAGTVVPYHRLKKAMDEKRGVSTKNLPKRGQPATRNYDLAAQLGAAA